jgi:hypothetical protein
LLLSFVCVARPVASFVCLLVGQLLVLAISVAILLMLVAGVPKWGLAA